MKNRKNITKFLFTGLTKKIFLRKEYLPRCYLCGRSIKDKTVCFINDEEIFYAPIKLTTFKFGLPELHCEFRFCQECKIILNWIKQQAIIGAVKKILKESYSKN